MRRQVSLRNFDLNLLVTLRAILRHRNVSAAAKELSITQPAASNSLSRLRSMLDDQILVRGPKGMILTERAERLQEPLREVLSKVEENLFLPREFDPKTSERKFILAMNSYAEVVLAPCIVAAVAKAAPNCTLGIRALQQYTPIEQLAAGTLDLCITFTIDGYPAGLKQLRLLTESFVCIVRQDHSEVGESITLKQYLAQKHALVSPLVEHPDAEFVGIVDDELKKLGKSRKVVTAIPNFFLASSLVTQTDYIMTVPEGLARAYEKAHKFRILPTPFAMQKFETNLIWHERNDRDPAMMWFRNLITATVQKNLKKK